MPTAKAKAKSMTQGEMVKSLATESGLQKSQVTCIITSLTDTIKKELKAHGAVKVLGLFSVKVKQVPARAARRGVDPFTKLERDFPAKPASKRLKVFAMKKLKDSVFG